jgi:hypothetical protein
VALGYGLVAIAPLLVGFVPVFTLIRLVKIAENSIDYSLMNTTRQVLFLPSTATRSTKARPPSTRSSGVSAT